MSRALNAAAVIAAVAGALIAGAAFVGPPDEVDVGHPERIEPVMRSASVCPYVGGEARATSRVGVLAIPDVAEPGPLPGAEGDDDQEVTVRRLTGNVDEPPKPATTVDTRGERALKTVDRNSPVGYAVRAEGRLAPGVVAEQWMLADGPDMRGLVTAPCTRPEREHWFVGVSTADGSRARLVLSNINPTPATVSVKLWDEDGPVDTGVREITVEPHSQELVLLEAMAPDRENLTVQVVAGRGRVAAAIDHRESSDGQPGGISMIPAAAAPSETVVIPGIPGNGGRSLRIFTPSGTDAFVTLEVLGPDGAFRPVELDALTVPAEGMLEVNVGDAVGEDASAIRLTSDEPITASLRVVRTASEALPEIAYSAATPTLPAGPTALVMGRDNDDMSTSLILSAVGEMGGRVTVRTLDADGEVGSEETLEIAGGSTLELDLPAASGSWVTAVIEVSAANTIVGARQIVGNDEFGRLIDLMPLRAAQLTVLVPQVAGELAP